MPGAAGVMLSVQSHPLGRGLLHKGPNCCQQLVWYDHTNVRGQRRINQASPAIRYVSISSIRLKFHFILNTHTHTFTIDFSFQKGPKN